MITIFWPSELKTDQTRWVRLGRIVHWALTTVALCLVALTVVISGTLLQATAGEGLWNDPAIILTFTGSIAGFGVFMLGRTLRFVLARE